MFAVIVMALIVGGIGGGIGTLIAGEGSVLATVLAIIGLVLGGFWGLQYVAAKARGGW